MMTDRITVSGLDHSNEGTRAGGYISDLTAANFDAQVAAAQAIQTAIQGVSLIAHQGLTITVNNADRETTPAADPYAQREHKWLVTMSDGVANTLVNLEIGGADLSLLASDGSTMDVSGGAGAALVTALEANLKSKAGNALTFVKAVHVGRNT